MRERKTIAADRDAVGWIRERERWWEKGSDSKNNG